MPEEERSGVRLTNLDEPLSPDAGATKRELVDYLDAVADRFVPVLAGRALSVIRVLRGQSPFMQKNLPKYAPPSIPTLEVTTQDGKRTVHYPVCDDRETLLWFANQRAVEYHPTLFRGHAADGPTHLVLDLDPPTGSDSFAHAVEAALLVRRVLDDAGMSDDHGSASPSRPGTVATVKSDGDAAARSSQGSGNDTGRPGRSLGLYAAATVAPPARVESRNTFPPRSSTT